MERKWTSKGILMNLTYMRDTARKLLARGKKYDRFLRLLLQWDELYGGVEPPALFSSNPGPP